MIRENGMVSGLIRSIALIVFALLPLTAYPLKAAESGQLSKKELKALIKSANTPAEHQRVANFYRSEAARLRARAAKHEAMIAANYVEPQNASKLPDMVGKSHCRHWVKEYRREADQADANAALHEQMAAVAATGASIDRSGVVTR